MLPHGRGDEGLDSCFLYWCNYCSSQREHCALGTSAAWGTGERMCLPFPSHTGYLGEMRCKLHGEYWKHCSIITTYSVSLTALTFATFHYYKIDRSCSQNQIILKSECYTLS